MLVAINKSFIQTLVIHQSLWNCIIHVQCMNITLNEKL